MNKAFTLMELVFVIVIASIIASVMLPSSKNTKLNQAATQLVSHIRYTQHLALVNDKYDTSDSGWYHELWQIRFTDGTIASNNKVAYAIFSDWKGTHSRHPEREELAKDPVTGKLITGGVTNTVEYDDPDALREANLGIAYGVEGISFSSSCKYYGSKRIAFDFLGRPIRGDVSSPANSNTYIGSLKFLKSRCDITICSVSDCSVALNDEKITIAIEPETGYTHILKN